MVLVTGYVHTAKRINITKHSTMKVKTTKSRGEMVPKYYMDARGTFVRMVPQSYYTRRRSTNNIHRHQRMMTSQMGGALGRKTHVTLQDKIAAGAAMFLSGPAPSFVKLGAVLGKVAAKGIWDNVNHYRGRR